MTHAAEPTWQPPLAATPGAGIETQQYVTFSLAERDRRWAALRALMDRDGLDALVTPPNNSNATDWQADGRYISGCVGLLGVVFPRDGEVMVTTHAAHRQGPTVQQWVGDMREANRAHGRRIGERLVELGLDGCRIGVTGLGPGTRSAEGTILHGTYEAIRAAAPRASLVDATELLQEVREVKGREEIEALRLSVELIERAIEAMAHWAQPGVPEYVVWAEAMHALFVRNSELNVHFNWVAAQNPLDTQLRPTMRPLAPGDIIRTEIEASVIGYRAQQYRPLAVHRCPHHLVGELARIHAEEFYPRVLELLRAGVTVGDLVRRTVELGARLAPKTGPLAGMQASMTLHGRGLGDDRPLTLTRSGGDSVYAGTDRHWDLPFPKDGVYVCKPALFTVDGAFMFRWGDTVRTTPGGAVRMGSAPTGLLSSEPREVRWPATPLQPGPLAP